MAEKTLKIAGAAGSALLLAGLGGAALAPQTTLATEAGAGSQVGAEALVKGSEAQAVAATPAVRQTAVEGAFAWTQAEVTPVDLVASRMGGVARVLCGSSRVAEGDRASAEEWVLRVTGDVESEVVATLGELAEEGAYHATMGCSCAGNGVDGLASVNAEVEGVTAAYLLEAAGASESANTIVFVSDDGYEVALPIAYVTQRASMVVYTLNGAELADSVGGVNQLWLGSTSARYFARNVAEVRVETRDEGLVPPVPGTPDAGGTYANVPNIGVVFGGEVA